MPNNSTIPNESAGVKSNESGAHIVNPSPGPETAAPKPEVAAPKSTSAVESNTFSFLNEMSVNRQPVAEPPKPAEQVVTGEENAAETTPVEGDQPKEEGPKEPISMEGLGITAEVIVETADLLIPELMCRLNPNGDSEAEEYSLDPDDTDDPKEKEKRIKRKKFLIESHVRYFDFKKINMTPGQQLLFAYSAAYGVPLLLEGAHRLLDYLDKRKDKKKVEEQIQAQVQENPLVAQNLELARLLKETQETLQSIRNEQAGGGSSSQPPVQVVQESASPVEAKLTEETEETTQNHQTVVLKPCAHPDCQNSFAPGTGYSQNKESKFYDSCCSTKCMRRVIGGTGGRKKKSN